MMWFWNKMRYRIYEVEVATVSGCHAFIRSHFFTFVSLQISSHHHKDKDNIIGYKEGTETQSDRKSQI